MTSHPCPGSQVSFVLPGFDVDYYDPKLARHGPDAAVWQGRQAGRGQALRVRLGPGISLRTRGGPAGRMLKKRDTPARVTSARAAHQTLEETVEGRGRRRVGGRAYHV